MDIVHRYKNIIENKKTDQVHLIQKKESWKQIANDFNAQNLHVPRKWNQLKTLYEHTKHDAKKEKAADRVSCLSNLKQIPHFFLFQVQTYLTGGGKKQKTISEISEKALAIIEEQITPNKNNYDSSAQFYSDFLVSFLFLFFTIFIIIILKHFRKMMRAQVQIACISNL